jgi:hypothetical protein
VSVHIEQRHAAVRPRDRRSRSARYGAATAAAVVAISAALLASAETAQAAAAAVPMGTAEPFAVLGGTGITNTGTTTIHGDIGSLPNPVMTVTGQIRLTGTNHSGDGVTATAKSDLTAAYLNASPVGHPVPDGTVSADLAGQTLTPGVYTSASSLAISGPLPLTLTGTASDVFVFQAGSTLITSANTSVVLTGGVTACNVFWQVGSSTTLGVNSTFRGTIMTLSNSTMQTGATLEGSLLTRNGAVTLDSNTILRPACASSETAGLSIITGTGTTPSPVTPTAAGQSGAGGQVRRVPVGSVNAGGGGTGSAVGRLWSY